MNTHQPHIVLQSEFSCSHSRQTQSAAVGAVIVKSSSSLGDSLLEASEEAIPVGVDILARGLLGVDEDTAVGFGLGTSEDGNLKAAGDTGIHVKVVHELTSTEELLSLVDELDGVAAVASAATVLDLHKVACILVAKDLVGLSLHSKAESFVKYIIIS